MKYFLFIIVLLMLIVISCQQDFILVVKKQPGAVTGRIYPDSVLSIVTLRQGSFKVQELTDPEGYFYFDDIKIGKYKIKAEAENYGSIVKENIQVEESTVTDLGVLQLSTVPYPLYTTHPQNNDFLVSPSQRLVFNFRENIDTDSFEKSFSISPYATIDHFEYSQSSNYSYMSAYVYVSLNYDTDYVIRLDKALKTLSGEYIDFPFTATFRTDKFRINDMDLYSSSSSDYASIRFSGALKYGEDYDQYITINPTHDIDVIMSNAYYISVRPDICWKSDTKYELIVQQGIQSETGIVLKNDTSFTFYTKKFDIEKTYPYHGRNFVSRSSDIEIKFNYVIDESTIEDAITVNPDFSYQISTARINNYSKVYLLPDSLSSKTKYTITIDSDVKDFYGSSLYSGHTFYFVTDSI